MEIQKYSKKRLYEMLRAIIFSLLSKEVIAHLLEASRKEDKIGYKSFMLTTVGLSPSEHRELLLHQARARDFSSFRPSFYTLNKKDLINILSGLVSKLDDYRSIEKLALLAATADDKYVYPEPLLKFLQLRNYEFNEIINYEESLSVAGVKDSGLDERSLETEALIKHFLIIC